MVNKSFRRTNGAIATILLACLLSGWNMNKEEKSRYTKYKRNCR